MEQTFEKTRDSENKEQTARKEVVSFRRRSQPLERDWKISKETRECENKEQTAQKELEGFRGSKPLERDLRISKEARAIETRSTLLERS